MLKLQTHPSIAVISSIFRRLTIRVQVLSNEERYKMLLNLQACGPRRNGGTTHPQNHINSTLDHHKSLTWSRPHGARISGTRWLSPNVAQRTPGLRQSNFSV